MTTLEKQFDEEFLRRCEVAEAKSSCRLKRMVQNVQKFGGVKTAQEIMRKGRLSDDFEKMAEEGLLALTMEALVIEAAYADLFTDDEVNACYEALCEHGYY